jgi:hypothetical protein
MNASAQQRTTIAAKMAENRDISIPVNGNER